MLSPARAFHFILSLAVFTLLALVATSPVVVVPTLAAPLPVPMYRNADFAPKPPQNADMPVARDVRPIEVVMRDILDVAEGLAGAGSFLPRDLDARELEARQTDVTNFISNLNLLTNYYNGMQTHASNFRSLARQPTASRSSNFNQESAAELTGFQTDLLGFQSLLSELGADKGLANYDRNNELETLLKDLVNSVKYLLSDIDEMVYNLPGVGPTLGPIVYEIKCILDKVLDAVENLTDAILNAIQPILEPLIGQATNTACNSGFKLLGLCLLL